MKIWNHVGSLAQGDAVLERACIDFPGGRAGLAAGRPPPLEGPAKRSKKSWAIKKGDLPVGYPLNTCNRRPKKSEFSGVNTFICDAKERHQLTQRKIEISDQQGTSRGDNVPEVTLRGGRGGGTDGRNQEGILQKTARKMRKPAGKCGAKCGPHNHPTPCGWHF